MRSINNGVVEGEIRGKMAMAHIRQGNALQNSGEKFGSLFHGPVLE